MSSKESCYKLWRVESRSFCAGFLSDERGVVVESAPIIRKWLLGRKTGFGLVADKVEKSREK